MRKTKENIECLRVRDFIPKILTPMEQKKAELKTEIRKALTVYAGEDKDMIRAILTEKQKAKEDSIEFLENTLQNLKTPAQ